MCEGPPAQAPPDTTPSLAAVFQNGVISLIDCTLLEDPESTEEEGRHASCSHRHTRSPPKRWGPHVVGGEGAPLTDPEGPGLGL